MTHRWPLFVLAAALLMTPNAMAQDEDGPVDPLAPAPGAAEPDPEPAGGAPPPRPAGEDSKDEKLSLSWMRPSFGGLTGFGELISTEVVREGDAIGGGIGLRAGFIFQHQYLKMTKDFGGGSFRIKDRAQVYTFQAAVGVMDMAEISFSLPLVDQELSNSAGKALNGVFGTRVPPFQDQDLGFGNPELSAKFRAPLDIEMISLAAYTRLQIPWGEGNIVRPKRFPLEEQHNAQWELGTAVGAHFGMISGFMNLGFGLIEGGTQLFHYRFGVAINPIDMIEFAMYYDAFELEGSTRSTGTWGWTATVKFDSYFVGVGQELLVLDNGLDDTLDGLGKTAGDTGTAWTLTLMAGATF